MDWPRNQSKLFRALLYCYPAEFRHEYGAEMEQLFADRLQSEPRFRLWLETLADLVCSAFREHASVLASDVRYGLRVLAAAPGFTTIALLVLALGIGATTAVYSLVDAVLLRSLPFGHPGKLVYLWSPNPKWQGAPRELAPSVPDFYGWQRLSHSFSSMAMLNESKVSLVEGGVAHRISAAEVSGDFFHTLEASPTLGRSIDMGDEQPGHRRVAVISNALWRSQFGADPDTVGKHIQLNRYRYTVIGVMPKGFGYPLEGDIPYTRSGFARTDIWLPLAYSAAEKTDRTNFAGADAVIGRLRNGVSVASAQQELKAIELHLNALYPSMWRGFTAFVTPLVQTIIGPVQKMLWLLLGAALLVLLIAVGNVANLLLVRATARAHEMGIRTALGAERRRIVRQLLTESLLLSCFGCALGIGFAYAAVRLLVRLNPGKVPRFDTATLDGAALAVAIALACIAGLLCGLAPAVSASRANLNELLKRGARNVAGGSKRGRFALIVAEVALSVILLSAAGLLIRSYLNVMAVNPGFSPAALTFQLNLNSSYNTQQRRQAFYREFLAKLEGLRGVQYAGLTNVTPLSGYETEAFAEVRGFGRSEAMVETRSVTPGYRKALGTPLLLGRDFTHFDMNGKTPVAMVNQAFVKAYFHGRNPLGQQVRVGIGKLMGNWCTVVGVVGNVHHDGLTEPPKPQVIKPFGGGNRFAVRYSIPVQQASREIRTALRSLDPTLAPDNIHTMGDRIAQSNARRRFQTALLTGFAALAVFLALAGLYAVMSYSVKRRTAEIGIRMALGSPRSRVLGLILGQGLCLTALGLLIGLGGALALTHLVSSWLFGVQPADPVTFALVPAFVLAVACLACLVPACNAMRIDPIRTLREE